MSLISEHIWSLKASLSFWFTVWEKKAIRKIIYKTKTRRKFFMKSIKRRVDFIDVIICIHNTLSNTRKLNRVFKYKMSTLYTNYWWSVLHSFSPTLMTMCLSWGWHVLTILSDFIVSRTFYIILSCHVIMWLMWLWLMWPLIYVSVICMWL